MPSTRAAFITDGFIRGATASSFEVTEFAALSTTFAIRVGRLPMVVLREVRLAKAMEAEIAALEGLAMAA